MVRASASDLCCTYVTGSSTGLFVTFYHYLLLVTGNKNEKLNTRKMENFLQNQKFKQTSQIRMVTGQIPAPVQVRDKNHFYLLPREKDETFATLFLQPTILIIRQPSVWSRNGGGIGFISAKHFDRCQ